MLQNYNTKWKTRFWEIYFSPIQNHKISFSELMAMFMKIPTRDNLIKNCHNQRPMPGTKSKRHKNTDNQRHTHKARKNTSNYSAVPL